MAYYTHVIYFYRHTINCAHTLDLLYLLASMPTWTVVTIVYMQFIANSLGLLHTVSIVHTLDYYTHNVNSHDLLAIHTWSIIHTHVMHCTHTLDLLLVHIWSALFLCDPLSTHTVSTYTHTGFASSMDTHDWLHTHQLYYTHTSILSGEIRTFTPSQILWEKDLNNRCWQWGF